jgi:MFS family permease
MSAAGRITLIDRLGWLLVLAPIMGVAMIAAAVHGFTLPLVALIFDRWGLGAHLVGLNAAAGTCGILLLGPFLPGIIARVGLPRVVAAAILLATLALGALAALPHLVAWFLAKALLGVSLSVIWASTELWINLKVDDAYRGRAFSLFSLLYWFGFACGPGIIGLAGFDGALPLLIGAGVMATAFLLLLLMPRDSGRVEGAARRRLPRIPLWPAVMVLVTALMGGMGDGTLPALLPTFGLGRGAGEAGALGLLTAFVVGGVAFQWPVGWLADKVSERVLIFCCIGAAGLCLSLLPLAAGHIALRLPLCFVVGGVVMSISTLGLVAVGRTCSGGQLAVMSTWFSVLYEVGATVGPVIAGMAMVRLGADGLPLTLALACAIACILFLIGADRARTMAAADRAGLHPAP